MKSSARFGMCLVALALPVFANAQSSSSDNRSSSIYRPYIPPTAPVPSTTRTPVVRAEDGTYLGRLSGNPYDAESVANPYGRYGSRYSPDSVKNPYGRYGSPYSPQSATNPYATQAPRLSAPDTGKSLGRLSANPYAPDSTANPYGPYGSPYSPSSINNPYSPYYVPPAARKR
jgi:hypothetical protein